GGIVMLSAGDGGGWPTFRDVRNVGFPKGDHRIGEIMVGPSRFKLPNGCLAAPSQGFYWCSTSFRASSLGCSRSAVQSPCGRWRIKKQSPRSVLAVTGRFELPNGCLAAPSPASTGAPLRFAHLPWGTRDRQFNHI